METTEKAALINRLKSIAGHVNGIAAMVEQDRYCVDVIKQVQAAQAALAKASQIILDNHLRTCLTTAIRGDDPDERERVLAEISDVFSINSRS
ncbi:MAG TPA: metal-sensing transcriptional repressor [Aggregatilineales bacterium]|nr:metal-sensing transcriptional repressor [Aggregatilineales bacterium]